MSRIFRNIENKALLNYNQRASDFENQNYLSGTSLRDLVISLYRNAQINDQLSGLINNGILEQLTVANLTTFNGNLTVNGTAYFVGGNPFELSENLVLSTITVDNITTLEGPIIANGTLTVSGLVTINNSTTINGEFALNGNATNDLTVKGGSKNLEIRNSSNREQIKVGFNKSLDIYTGAGANRYIINHELEDSTIDILRFRYLVSGVADINLTVFKDNTITFAKTTFDSNVTISTGLFNVTTEDSSVQNLSVQNLLDVTDLASFNGGVNASGTLAVSTENTTVSNLSVQSSMNINEELNVLTGNTTVSNLTVNELLQITDISSFSNNVSVLGTLGVTGNTTVSNLSVDGTLQLTNMSATGTFDVTGVSTFESDVTLGNYKPLILSQDNSSVNIKNVNLTVGGSGETLLQTDTREYISKRVQQDFWDFSTGGATFNLYTGTKDIVRYFGPSSSKIIKLYLPNFKSQNNNPSVKHKIVVTGVSAGASTYIDFIQINVGTTTPTAAQNVFAIFGNDNATSSILQDSPYRYKYPSNGQYAIECISTGGPNGEWIINIDGY